MNDHILDLQQITIHLFNYFNNPINKMSILIDIEEVEKNYQSPINSWIYGMVYQYFRTRLQDIQSLKSMIQMQDTPTEWLMPIINFFKKGAWTSTSANTLFIQKCLEKSISTADEVNKILFTNQTLLTKLTDLFSQYVNDQLAIQKTKTTIETYWLENNKAERLEELSNIHWPNIKTTSNKIVNQIQFMQSQNMRPVQINKLSQREEYNQVITRLESLLSKSSSPSSSIAQQLKLKKNNHNLLDILTSQFNDPTTKKLCCASISKNRKNHTLNRAFDDFPFSIINDNELKNLYQEFEELLTVKVNTDMQLINKSDRFLIQTWENRIIKLACQNLLDTSGNINNDILLLLKLDTPPLSVKEKIAFICGYVGRINQQIMSLSSDLIQADETVYNAYNGICNFVNKNYGQWVVGSLNKTNHSPPMPISTLSAVGIGASVVLSTSMLGFLLFKQYSSSNEVSDKHWQPSSKLK